MKIKPALVAILCNLSWET